MDKKTYNNGIELINADMFDLEPFPFCDYIFTSPPYNRKRNDKYAHYEDTIDDYLDFLNRSTERMLIHSRNGVFLNIQKNYYNKAQVNSFIGKWANYIQEIFVWVKTNPMPANAKNITNAYEFIFYLGNSPLKANKTYTKNVFSSSVNSNMPKEHKAVMKLELAEWVIKNFTQEKCLILDPFGGLATTALACMRNNRECICIEKSPIYHDMAIKRIDEEINKTER